MTVRRRGRAGFTLLETVLAVSVSSVLLLALGSTVLVASRAVPTGNEALIYNAEIERALGVLRADFGEALGIQSSGFGITVAVPDRDGDGKPELIEYTITAKRVLTRSVNRGPAYDLVGPFTNMTFLPVQRDGRFTAVTITIDAPKASPTRRTVVVRILNTPKEV